MPDVSDATDTIRGRYSASDCTVSDVWHSVISGSDSFHESVLVDEGKEFFILNTTEGAPVAISGHAKRLGKLPSQIRAENRTPAE